jgi:Armadillo/beta-catenin-like repeat
MFSVADLVVRIIANIPNSHRTILNISEVSKHHYNLIHQRTFWIAIGYCHYDRSCETLSTDQIKSILTCSQFQSDEERTTVIADLYSDDRNLQLLAASHIRGIVTLPYEVHPYEDIVNAGIVDRLLELSLISDAPSLQSECLWILQNISGEGSTEMSLAVGSSYLFPGLVSLFGIPGDVGETACWILSNVLGDYHEHQRIYDAGLLSMIASDLVNQDTLSEEKKQALASLLRSLSVHPSIGTVFLPLLLDIVNLLRTDDKYTKAHCRFVLQVLTRKVEECALALLADENLMKALLEHSAIAAVGNLIVVSDTRQVSAFVDLGLFACLRQRIELKKNLLDVVWILSNIATEPDVLPRLIHSGLIPIVVGLYDTAEQKLKKEIEQMMVSAAEHGDEGAHMYFVENDMVRILMNAVETWSDIQAPLSALAGVLEDATDELVMQVRLQFPRNSGYLLVDCLIEHGDSDIATTARTILEDIL